MKAYAFRHVWPRDKSAESRLNLPKSPLCVCKVIEGVAEEINWPLVLNTAWKHRLEGCNGVVLVLREELD